MKIGVLGTLEKNRINFRQWVKQFYKQGVAKDFKIVRIFLPAKFDNFTLIMHDEENNIEVSRTVSKEIGKQFLKRFNFSTKTITKGILWLTIDEQGELHLTLEEHEKYGYIFEKNSFVLRDLTQYHVDDDIPF
jgi:hypothetical protein